MGSVFGKGAAQPPAPDYPGAAAAQGAANKETAIATSRLNNPNVIGPTGTQTWTEGATPDARATLTQTLSPEQQALYNKQVQTKGLLGDVGIKGAESLGGIVGKQLDISGAPAAPGSAEATRQATIDAMMGRVNEDTNRNMEQKQSDLIAAGIRPGTKAYDDAMALIERGRTDARQQAIIAGGAEAQRDFGMDTDARRNAIAETLMQRQTPLNEINALMSGSQVSNPFATPGVQGNTNIAPPPIFGAAQAQGGYGQSQANAQNAMSGNFMSGLFGLGAGALAGGWKPW